MTPAQEAAHNCKELRQDIEDTVERIGGASYALAGKGSRRAAGEALEVAREGLKAQLDLLFAALAAPCLKCAEGAK